MAIDRLGLYNKALLACGERFLSALTDSNEPRRLLDNVWDSDGREYCLEQGAWQFAMRTTRIEVDESFTTPDFGYQYAFTKPTDWVATDAVCQDEFFRVPLLDYADEMGYWFASIQPLYVKFISKGNTYGLDMSLWPASFGEYVANVFASRIIGKLAGDKSEQMKALFGPAGYPERGSLERSLHKARSAAARTQPTRFPATGAWVNSRRGGSRRGPMGDGGTSGSLTG